MWQQQSFQFPKPRLYSPDPTFALLSLGPQDPSYERIDRRGFRTLRWLEGELCAVTVGWNAHRLVVAVEGPGAVLERVEEEHASGLLGLRDRCDFSLPLSDPIWPFLRATPGLHLPRAFWLYEGALQVVLGQRVSWAEAAQNWRKLCRHYGQSRDGLWSAPSPRRLRGLSWAELARCGIEAKRAVALKGVAGALDFLPSPQLTPSGLQDRLANLPRIGPWTKSLICGQVWGDPDAVPLGDYGLPSLVSQAFGETRQGSDERMLELLKPYQGQRFRVLRYLWCQRTSAERRGPRLPLGQALGLPLGTIQR